MILLILGPPLALLGRQLVVAGLGLGSDFMIRCRGAGPPIVKGRIPRSKVGEIMEFCSRDMAGAGGFTVWGSWGPDRSLKLRWRGRLNAFERQRMRNFLSQCLR